MRKLVLGLAMVMVVMGLVGCGTTDDKKDGFVPEQVTESEVVTDNVKEDIEEIADGDLTKYYDVEKYVGTPRVETLTVYLWADTGNASVENDVLYFEITGVDKSLKNCRQYQCIVCDNNTPDDITDDVLAYIFTE